MSNQEKLNKLLALKGAMDNLQHALTALIAAQDHLSIVADQAPNTAILEEVIEDVDRIGTELADKGQALSEELGESDRCAGCPGTEGGCCK